ncbi:hypothetical protein, partial [Colwellia hornerae]|uniref:hypothetical protein n=1 Tax=Colwellia hornerae TaxID=89402 RepID=UPI001CB993F4
ITLFQTKKNQSEDWFISALQQMWWARQESNLRPEVVSFVAALFMIFISDEKKPTRKLVHTISIKFVISLYVGIINQDKALD